MNARAGHTGRTAGARRRGSTPAPREEHRRSHAERSARAPHSVGVLVRSFGGGGDPQALWGP
eukprot:404656-Pyramimonas_sp.AAC.1